MFTFARRPASGAAPRRKARRMSVATLAVGLALLACAPTFALAQSNPASPPNLVATEANSADAPQASVSTESLLEILWPESWVGRFLIMSIGVCSVLLMIFIFERAFSLRKGVVIPGPFVKRLLQQAAEGEISRDEALQICHDNGSPTAEVFAAAVKKWGRSSVEVEQAIIDSGERITNGLRKYLRLLNGIATVSPLLGLLGTVTGMIEAFNKFGTGNPEDVVPGISQALVTTALGLCVAIPALIAYLFFVSRVDQLIIQIDSLGQELVNSIAADGVPNPTSRRSASSERKKTKRSGERGAA